MASTDIEKALKSAAHKGRSGVVAVKVSFGDTSLAACSFCNSCCCCWAQQVCGSAH